MRQHGKRRSVRLYVHQLYVRYVHCSAITLSILFTVMRAMVMGVMTIVREKAIKESERDS